MPIAEDDGDASALEDVDATPDGVGVAHGVGLKDILMLRLPDVVTDSAVVDVRLTQALEVSLLLAHAVALGVSVAGADVTAGVIDPETHPLGLDDAVMLRLLLSDGDPLDDGSIDVA